jgi:hypothetical protein
MQGKKSKKFKSVNFLEDLVGELFWGDFYLKNRGSWVCPKLVFVHLCLYFSDFRTDSSR